MAACSSAADALVATGLFGAIRGDVIDDVGLAARGEAGLGLPIRLAVSAGDVRSVREYRTSRGFWRTVRRTAFTQLRHSWCCSAVTIALLSLLFAAPPVLARRSVVDAASCGCCSAVGRRSAWLVATVVYLPTVRLYGLFPAWALTLPLAGSPLRRDDGRLGVSARARGPRRW